MLSKQEIESILEAILSSQTYSELDITLKKIFEHYGAERYAFVDILNVGQEKSIKGFLTTYPQDWINHYLENKYYNYDPVFLSCGKMRLPFHWNKQTLQDLTPIQKQIFKDASAFNIQHGTTIPLFPRADGQSFLTILDHLSIPPYVAYVLTIASQLYYDRRRILDANHCINLLTYREKEILQMKAQGLSIKIISHRLGISDSTIIFHLKNIRQKLKATSLSHALFLFGQASAQTTISSIEETLLQIEKFHDFELV